MNKVPDYNLPGQPLPRVSIITVTYNAAKWLTRAIDSVVNQSYVNLEYIIIDGGSTDTTVSIINAYQTKVSRFVCGPDRGIYDAMNKGIGLASGEWLYFLGGDDMLAGDGILEAIFRADLTPYSLIIGDVVRFGSGKRYVSTFDWRLVFKNTICHQAAFYRKSLFESFRYEPDSKVSADYELNLKSYFERRRFKKVTFVISRCGNDGVSKKALFHGYQEEMRIRSKYLTWPSTVILNFLTLGRYALKSALLTVQGAILFRK